MPFHESLISGVIGGLFGGGGDESSAERSARLAREAAFVEEERRKDVLAFAANEAELAENILQRERNAAQVEFNRLSQEEFGRTGIFTAGSTAAAGGTRLGGAVGMFPPGPGEPGFSEFFGFGGGTTSGPQLPPGGGLATRPLRDSPSNLLMEQHILKDLISGVNAGVLSSDSAIRAAARKGGLTLKEFTSLTRNVPLMLQIWASMGGMWIDPQFHFRRMWILDKINDALQAMPKRRRRSMSIRTLVKMGRAAKAADKALKRAGLRGSSRAPTRACICRKKPCVCC